MLGQSRCSINWIRTIYIYARNKTDLTMLVTASDILLQIMRYKDKNYFLPGVFHNSETLHSTGYDYTIFLETRSQNFHQIFKGIHCFSKRVKNHWPRGIICFTWSFTEPNSDVWWSQKSLFKNKSCSRVGLVVEGGLIKIPNLVPKTPLLSHRPPCYPGMYHC